MKDIVLKEHPISSASKNYVQDYLVNLGIAEKDAPIFYQTSRYTPKWDGKLGDNPDDLPNINEGADMLLKALNNKKKIFVQVDSDTDGFTSSAIFYNYVKARYPFADIVYRLHEDKQHGIILDTIPADADLIVIPDAGSMQEKELRALDAQGKQVLVLDHHEYDDSIKYSDNIVIINSQYKYFTNPYLSGAGVVFLFVKKLDERFGAPIADRYSDLAALGIISDVMDTKTIGNHMIIYQGLHAIRNKMFRELLMKQSFKISDPTAPTKIDIAFYITPLINGLIRSGGQDEKEDFFKAMLEDNETDPNQLIHSEYRGTPREETIYQRAARLAANAKSRQDAAKKKIIAFLEKKIEEEHLNDHKLLAVKLNKKESEKVNKNITGLAAMDIANEYNKPTIIIREVTEADNEIHYSGSGRSNGYPGLPSLKAFLEETELCDFVEGHANAFGVEVPERRFPELIAYADQYLGTVNYDDKHIEVDYFFRGMMNTPMLEAFATQTFLYGNGIPEPLFAFDMEISTADMNILGKDGQTLKIRKSGIDFIMFKAGEMIEELQKNQISSVIIVGRPAINEWMGRRTIQIRIEDIDIQTRKESILRDLI